MGSLLTAVLLTGCISSGRPSDFDDGEQIDEPSDDFFGPVGRDAGRFDAGFPFLDSGSFFPLDAKAGPSSQRGDPELDDASLAAPEGAYDGGLGADWLPLTCSMREVLVPQGITPTKERDYLAVYRAWDGSPMTNSNTLEPLLRDGNACRDAADVEECRKQLLEVFTRRLCGLGCDDIVVVSGNDGSFETIETRAELLALLGEIDTPSEAIALVLFDGFSLPCSAPIKGDLDGLSARVMDGKIVLTGGIDDCSVNVVRQTLTVLPNGNVNVRRERLDWLKPACSTDGVL